LDFWTRLIFPLDEQRDVAVVIEKHGVGLVTVKQSEGHAKEVKKQVAKARESREEEEEERVQYWDTSAG
jgi:hypothetical protein